MPIQFNPNGCGKRQIVSGNLGIDGYIPSKETLLHMLKAHNDPQYEYLLSLGLENWSIVSFDPSQNQACIIYKNPTTRLDIPTIITLPNLNIPFAGDAPTTGGPDDGIAGGTGGGSSSPVGWEPIGNNPFSTGNGECC